MYQFCLIAAGLETKTGRLDPLKKQVLVFLFQSATCIWRPAFCLRNLSLMYINLTLNGRRFKQRHCFWGLENRTKNPQITTIIAQPHEYHPPRSAWRVFTLMARGYCFVPSSFQRLFSSWCWNGENGWTKAERSCEMSKNGWDSGLQYASWKCLLSSVSVLYFFVSVFHIRWGGEILNLHICREDRTGLTKTKPFHGAGVGYVISCFPQKCIWV